MFIIKIRIKFTRGQVPRLPLLKASLKKKKKREIEEKLGLRKKKKGEMGHRVPTHSNLSEGTWRGPDPHWHSGDRIPPILNHSFDFKHHCPKNQGVTLNTFRTTAFLRIVDFTLFDAFSQLLSVITPKLFEIGNQNFACVTF